MFMCNLCVCVCVCVCVRVCVKRKDLLLPQYLTQVSSNTQLILLSCRYLLQSTICFSWSPRDKFGDKDARIPIFNMRVVHSTSNADTKATSLILVKKCVNTNQWERDVFIFHSLVVSLCLHKPSHHPKCR